MRSFSLSPRAQAALWLLVTLLSVAAIWTGAADMQRLGRETGSTAARIGFGIVGAVLGAGCFFLSLRLVQVVRRARLGVGEIARWCVPPHDLDDFRTNDAALNKSGRRNDLRVPRVSPPTGLEVVFLDDHVVVAGRAYGLVTTGMYRFSSVQVIADSPLAIEFDMDLTTLAKGSAGFHMMRSSSVLRVPVARTAREQAVKVYTHFRAVDAREIVVNPDFYGKRIRFGFWWLLVSLACAVAGFAMNRPHMTPEEVVLPVALAVGGTICAMGACVLMLIAWKLRGDQFRKR